MDYGFRNCKSPDEEKLLREVYQQLLWDKGADFGELHNAAYEGRIFDFASKHIVPLHPRFKRLMKSMYTNLPLEGGAAV
jgi:hypothetical protein